MSNIHIGSVKVAILDYAVSCNAILGIRDSGKTVTAKGLAEQLIEHKIPFVVFDAVGKWRWMKVAGEGIRGRGYPVVVAGGRQPDLPLTTHSVGEIVRSAIREKIPLIIDLYDPKLSKADWRRIVRESIHIIHYEADGACHVFLEEAAEFVPQKVMDGETYAEVEKLARMGGNASVGITLINQRSQEVNKAVLDLSHNLILGCQIGNKAIEAVEKWVDRLAPDIAEKVTKSLPKLKSGQAWVWTRSNPDEPTLEQMPMCRSLHPDRRTPEVTLKAAAIDTDEFVSRLSASIPKVIAEAKANDPAELRKEIAKLKTELAAKPEPETPLPPEKIVTENDLAFMERVIRESNERNAQFSMLLEKHLKAISTEHQHFLDIQAKLNQIKNVPPNLSPVARRNPVTHQGPDRHRLAPPKPAVNGDFQPNKTQQRILDALAWFESVGTHEPTNLQVGAIALIDSTGGHFSNIVGPLSTAGLIERGNKSMRLTDVGRGYARVPEELGTMKSYHNMIRERVRRVRSATAKTVEMLDEIIKYGGSHVSAETIGEAVNIDHTGGHFSNTIGPLGTLGLIRRDKGIVQPTEILFPPALM